eukprot:TRINITY_DN25320_c0_g1_i1.p1 TRINITY_DN25320_c0_g1~~TRINITY_DN25320_c0_g1_i1.p1  ORF type:complete len:341 (+),score=53.42 TRINITY_DN25320_c0_g1_i1:98-1120(+)
MENSPLSVLQGLSWHVNGDRPTKLFIGGISRRTTTKQIRQHFSKHGRVLDCVAMRQPDGRPRRFGYVTLDSPETAEKYLREPQFIDERLVDVKPAVPDATAGVGGNFGGKRRTGAFTEAAASTLTSPIATDSKDGLEPCSQYGHDRSSLPMLLSLPTPLRGSRAFAASVTPSTPTTPAVSTAPPKKLSAREEDRLSSPRWLLPPGFSLPPGLSLPFGRHAAAKASSRGSSDKRSGSKSVCDGSSSSSPRETSEVFPHKFDSMGATPLSTTSQPLTTVNTAENSMREAREVSTQTEDRFFGTCCWANELLRDITFFQDSQSAIRPREAVGFTSSPAYACIA